MGRVRSAAGALLRRNFPGIHAKMVDYRGEGRFAGQQPQVVFSAIYREMLWGVNPDGTPSSGSGSTDPTVVEPYIAAVRGFLDELPKPITLVDLGCGDFQVGRLLVSAVTTYIGCDVVPELIDRHGASEAKPGVEFKHLDMVEAPLPEGDVATIRQVLQHLSNAQIDAILPKLRDFSHVIVTEHVPEGAFPANIDKRVGPGVRLGRGSGVVLGAPPFEMPGFFGRELCAVHGSPGLIVTTLWSRK